MSKRLRGVGAFLRRLIVASAALVAAAYAEPEALSLSRTRHLSESG
jgi:hypothetical protein